MKRKKIKVLRIVRCVVIMLVAMVILCWIIAAGGMLLKSRDLSYQVTERLQTEMSQTGALKAETIEMFLTVTIKQFIYLVTQIGIAMITIVVVALLFVGRDEIDMKLRRLVII